MAAERFDKLFVIAAWAIVLLCVLAGYAVSSLRMDTRLDRMLAQDDAVAAVYNRVLQDYGSDEFVIVAVSGKPLFDVAQLDLLTEAVDRLEAAPHVAHVTGIPQVFRDRFGGEDPEALEEEVNSSPFYDDLFVSRDRQVAGLFVQTDILNTPDSRRELVAGVKQAVEPLRAAGFRVDLVGVPVINGAINSLSISESKRFFPFAALGCILVLVLLMRSARAVLVVVLCGGLSILLTLGALTATGYTLNVVTASMPLVMWVLALANSIHLVTRYQLYLTTTTDRVAAVRAALRDVTLPCSLAAITTSFGFLSLTLANIPPIRQFGVWMAVGLLVSLAVNLVLGSCLLVLLRAGGPRWIAKSDGGHFRSVAQFASSFAPAVLLIFGLAMAAGVVGLGFVKTERNTLAFLPDESEVVASYKFVGERLTGMYTMDIIIGTPGGWLNPAYWAPVEQLASKLEESTTAARVISPLDFLKKMRQWDDDLSPEAYRLPETGERAEGLLGLLDDDDLAKLNRLVNVNGEEIRLSVLVRSTDSQAFLALDDEAQKLITALPAPLTGFVTGVSPQMQHMQSQLVTSQIRSFSLAFILVFICILIGLRSFRLVLVAIVPNVMPILATFGVMALRGINLDAGTVMVASIALGIAVDDTVHLLAAYRRKRQAGLPVPQAVPDALADVGPSVVVTSLTACIGFFTLSTSIFGPLHYFGLLSGISVTIALLSVLFFVPALLSFLGSRLNVGKLPEATGVQT